MILIKCLLFMMLGFTAGFLSAPFDMMGGKVYQRKWRFCPNCGADMRGEQDETD